jgi:hypothetical protein
VTEIEDLFQTVQGLRLVVEALSRRVEVLEHLVRLLATVSVLANETLGTGTTKDEGRPTVTEAPTPTPAVTAAETKQGG